MSFLRFIVMVYQKVVKSRKQKFSPLMINPDGVISETPWCMAV